MWRWTFTVCSFLRPSLFHWIELFLWQWGFNVTSFLRPSFFRSIFVLQKCHRSIVRSLLFFVHVAYCFLLLSIVLETLWTGTPGNCPFVHQIGLGLWRWAFTVCSFLSPSLFHQVELPYLPVYNAHPYIMRTLFFKTLSRKKIVIPIVIKATNRNIFSAKYNKIFFSITVYYKYP